MKRVRLFGLFLFTAILWSCGGSELNGFREIPNDTFIQNTEFRMTVVMTSCSDSCSTYEEATCDVSVNEDDKIIEIGTSVCFDRTGEENCRELCGAPILAHCTVPRLAAGTWTVKEGAFSRPITVR